MAGDKEIGGSADWTQQTGKKRRTHDSATEELSSGRAESGVGALVAVDGRLGEHLEDQG